MKNIFILLFCFFSIYAFGSNRVQIELPKREPSLRVYGSDGRNMVERHEYKYEFASMKVMVNKDPESKTGYYVPKTQCEALDEFKALLPVSYFNRLNSAFNLDTPQYGGVDDAAVTERLYDVEVFLIKSWGLTSDNKIFNYTNKNDPLDLIWFLMGLDRNGKCK